MALDLKATVSLDGSGFEAGTKRIEGAVHHLGNELKALAISAFGIDAIKSAIEKTIESVDKMVDSANRVGVNLEAFQELSFAVRQNGADVEQLVKFLEKLNETRVDPKKIEFFQRLGVNDPLKGGVDELFSKISAGLQGKNPGQFFPDLKQVGEKAAGPMVATLTDNLVALREEARNNVIVTTDSAVKIKFLKDQMTLLGETITAELAPAIGGIVEPIMKFANAVKSMATFLGTVVGGFNIEDLKESALHPFSKDVGFAALVADAAEIAGNQLAVLNYETDSRLAKLSEDQRLRGAFNGPTAPPPSDMPAAKEQRYKIYSDEFTRIGGFIGSTSNPLISINQSQLNELKQISENTKPLRLLMGAPEDFPIV